MPKKCLFHPTKSNAIVKAEVTFHNSKAAEKLAAMASEERERAEEASDKLKEILIQVSRRQIYKDFKLIIKVAHVASNT